MGIKRISSFLALALFACQSKTDFQNIPTKTKKGYFHAVIEIPSGTNQKFEYNKETREFVADKQNGVARTINFLPYPGNYGFIPSTFSNPEEGGDGDALDILVLSESVPTGSVLEIIPVTMLKLVDNNELDYKIIAIPAAKEHQIIQTKNYQQLLDEYPAIPEIIEKWFLNYDREDNLEIHGWGDRKEAISEIEKWQTD